MGSLKFTWEIEKYQCDRMGSTTIRYQPIKNLSTKLTKDHKNKTKFIKGELRSKISLLHVKVLILIKAKSNVFLWYVQCCSCTRRSKTKILTTRAPPSWIEFRLCNATWIDYLRLSNDFSGFYKRSINAGTWKSTITSHIQDVVFDVVTSQRQTQSKMAAP